VKVQASGLISKLVVHLDHKAISYSDINLWYGPLTIDTNNWAVECSVRVGGNPCNVEVVGNGGSFGERCKESSSAEGRSHKRQHLVLIEITTAGLLLLVPECPENVIDLCPFPADER